MSQIEYILMRSEKINTLEKLYNVNIWTKFSKWFREHKKRNGIILLLIFLNLLFSVCLSEGSVLSFWEASIVLWIIGVTVLIFFFIVMFFCWCFSSEKEEELITWIKNNL